VARTILIRFLVAGALLLPGWFLMAHMKSTAGTPPPGSPGAQLSEVSATATLAQAARVLSDYRNVHGTFAGASVSSVSGALLVRAGRAAFCIQTGTTTSIYHLDGTSHEDNSWNLGAVKGPCSAQ
jgi:hypothetical protein